MTPAEVEAIEARLGVTFPDEWRTWSPATERNYVRGVAELLPPERYVVGDDGEVVIGMSTEAVPLALVPKRRGSKVLKSEVYELRGKRREIVVTSFTQLLDRKPVPRRGELDFDERLAWAKAAGTRLADEATRARMPDLFAAIDFVTALPDRYAWIRDPYEILMLETARVKRKSVAALIDSWQRRDRELATIPVAELTAFLERR
jgi:hypothetical protein